jgi:predicted ATPase/signal transduction histidine kinase
MLQLEGYTIGEQIFSGKSFSYFRGKRDADSKLVFIKACNSDTPLKSELIFLQEDFNLAQNFKEGLTLQTVEIFHVRNKIISVFEDFDGIPLKEFLGNNNFFYYDSIKAIEVFIEIVKALGAFHRKDFIHKCLNPSHILYNSSTNEVRLTGFGFSAPIKHIDLEVFGLENMLYYISPEQTGRINVSIDQRSDFYSLGITFYECLTRTLPFRFSDTMALIHGHIAIEPPDISLQNEGLPKMLAAIIMKMIAKNKDDRYKGTLGLIKDLNRCLEMTRLGKGDELFELGENEISDVFHIPENISARKLELKVLEEAIQKKGADRFEAIFISGFPGMGKTTLVNQAKSLTSNKEVYFLSGTYKRYNKGIPFSAITLAMKGLVEQILASPKKELEEWKARLTKALGSQAQLITNLIPELELLIGISSIEALGIAPEDAENRLKTTFLNFIQVFTRSSKRLVMFLDDLHLADSSSLDLLRIIFNNQSSNTFLLIGGYNDNAQSPNKPLLDLVSDFRRDQAVSEIKLKPLQREDLIKLIEVNFPANSKGINEVGDILFSKTKGVLIFFFEFLSRAYKERGLYFNYEESHWSWDKNILESLPISDNVADLMLGKVMELSASSLDVLKLAACQGSNFNVSVLTYQNKQDIADINSALKEAIYHGIINFSPNQNNPSEENTGNVNEYSENTTAYSFIHDRLHQAVYSLVDEASKKTIHFDISQYLLENKKGKTLEDNIFEVANHLKIGIEKLIDDREKNMAIQTFTLAAKKAKLVTSYVLSFEYISYAKQFITQEHWEDDYNNTFDIYLQYVGNAFLAGNIPVGLKAAEEMLQLCKSQVEKAQVYHTISDGYMYRVKYEESYKSGGEALKVLGIKLPKKPSQLHVLWEIIKVQWMLRGKSYDDLYALPERTDAAAIITFNIYYRSLAYAINNSSELYAIISLRMFQLILKYGLGHLSYAGFVTYGSILAIGFGKYEKGHKFMELALRIGERNNDLFDIAGAHYGIGMNTFLTQPLQKCFDSFELAYQEHNLCGGVFYAASASYNLPCYLFYLGKPLKEIEANTKEYLKYTKNAGHLDANDLHRFYLFFLKTLQQDNENIEFGINATLENYPKLLEITTGFFYIFLMNLYYLCGKYENARKLLEPTEKFLNTQYYLLNFVEYHYFYSLLIGEVYELSNAKQKKEYRKKIRKAIKFLKKRAGYSPENFQHLYQTVNGLWHKISGEPAKALAEFESAIKIIPEGQYSHNKSILFELAGQVSLTLDKENQAVNFLEESYRGFKKWGARASCSRMVHRYPEQLSNIGQFATTEEYNDPSGVIDFKSVLKASLVLSGEIQLSKLLSNLIKIAIENAGAQRGFLLIKKHDKLVIEAEGAADNKNVKTMLGIPVEEDSMQLSTAIVNYVSRTGKSIVINDFATEERFSNDAYLQINQPKSITCQPIVHQTNLIGLLYLENNLTTGVFTSERKQVLELLSSQMAISIQNAQLYSNLEQTVKERTAALQEQKEEAEKLKERAEISEKFKEQFLANMSHEIRTPMHAISGMTKILRRNKPAPNQEKYLSAIHQSSDNLLVILNDILDLSKIEAGKIEIESISMNPFGVTSAVMEILRFKAEEKGLALHREITPDVPSQVMGDPTRLNQILINLVGNAIKFSEQGIVEIKLKKELVENKEVLQFSVTDKGVGIPEIQLKEIFGSFNQGSEGTTRKYGGTGLGLSISKQLVELQKGNIWVESEEGRGSTFYFTLPYIPAEFAPLDESLTSEEKIKAVGAMLSGLRILVAEDNEFNIMVAQDDLSYYIPEVNIDIAQNGEIALEKYQNKDYDLILMDVQMPKLNGYDTTGEIRKLEAGGAVKSRIPIIAMTASLLRSEIDLCTQAGMDSYIPKPYKVEELIGTIYEEVKKSKATVVE